MVKYVLIIDESWHGNPHRVNLYADVGKLKRSGGVAGQCKGDINSISLRAEEPQRTFV